MSCNQQPLGETLLKSGKSSSNQSATEDTDTGELNIYADNSSMVVSVDDADKVEVTGRCNDLNRKNNRILVEVFAGEDENTLRPYISNAISDGCLNVGTGYTGAGIPVDNKCFWVTKGLGVVEETGESSPAQPTRSYPQCHNGQFGFSVKLGKILPDDGTTNRKKYTIRFKLRTLEGTVADSTYSRVTVTRDLSTPVINTCAYELDAVENTPKMKIKTSPARFNTNIKYTFKRKLVDANNVTFWWTNAPDADVASGDNIVGPAIYTDRNASSVNASGDSTAGANVFEYDDWHILDSGFRQLLHGMTYVYTLTSKDSAAAYTSGDYTYNSGPSGSPANTPREPTMKSPALSCDTPRIILSTTPPQPGVGTCHALIESTYYYSAGVTYQWAIGPSSSWTGPGFNATRPADPPGSVWASCPDALGNGCTVSGLTSGATFYFAVREIGTNGEVGKWSTVYPCKAL